MKTSASASAPRPTTVEKSIAFEKSIDTHDGSLAARYRWACVKPNVASKAQTGGHNITINRSPRPAGPSAQALSKLVNTPHTSASALVLKTIFMFLMNIAAQAAPSAVRIAGIVRSRILQSSASDQRSMYSRSSCIHSSNERLLRPETCHKQVRPGFTLKRRFCQATSIPAHRASAAVVGQRGSYRQTEH